MAASPTTTKPKRKAQVRKDRVLYMCYKGELAGTPTFELDKDKFIDILMNDREMKVQKVVIPAGKPRVKTDAAAPTATA